MTYGEFLPSDITNQIVVWLSCICEGTMAIGMQLFFLCFFGKKITIKKSTVMIPMITALCCILISASSTVYYVVMGHLHPDMIIPGTEAGMPDSNPLSHILIIAAFFTGISSCSKRRILNGIETVIGIFAFELYIQLMIMVVIAFFSDNIHDSFEDMINIMVNESNRLFWAFYFLLCFSSVLYVYFRMYRRHNHLYIRVGYRLLFIVWEIALIIGIVSNFFDEKSESELITAMGQLIGIMFPILAIGVPFLILVIVSRKNEIQKNAIQEEYISSELEYIEQYKKNQEETRRFRHDIINNLSMVSALLKDEKKEEAENYLDELLGNVRGMSPKYVTGDEMLDCLIGMKITRMEASGIDFILDGTCAGGLRMKPVDVCTVFANALDNAIEACERMADDSEKRIRFEIKQAGQFFNLRLSNTYQDDTDKKTGPRVFKAGSRNTSKKDKDLHGYGSINIMDTVEKYNGMIKEESKDSVFTLSIMLPK